MNLHNTAHSFNHNTNAYSSIAEVLTAAKTIIAVNVHLLSANDNVYFSLS